MTRKSARPSFSRRPSFHKREKLDKAGRIRQRNQRVAFLVILLFLFMTGIIILVVRHGQKQEENTETSQETDGSDGYGPEEWMAEGAPYIDVQLLTPNEYSRPQLPLNQVDYIAIHYTANPGATAQNNRDYFENLATSHEAKVSSHFVVGLEGEVIQCIPTSEMSYATNSRNVDSISIECCHMDDTGVFEQATYDSVVRLAAWLCARFGLTSEQVIRHYDVTGKECPKYYVDHPDAWEQMKADISAQITVDQGLMGIS
ncbi:peptidoglycan recognition protein family protein [Blautia sp. Sow4_E7]|uniref:peptidoglycan recognition protein family protein n=1 Tax=Blautia sp. Sow4_E7 TaxID=3438749 RepID=UPI003F912E49